MACSDLRAPSVLYRLAVLIVSAGSVLAAMPISMASADNSSPVGVVELFTSHGCSSCPPADERLAELVANDPNLIALEFHVDYWNDLVWGSDGKWQDPFSKPEYSLRQHQYNDVPLKGRTGVYTPQAVINGQYAMVGVSKQRANQVLEVAPPEGVSVSIGTDAGQLLISVQNPDGLQDASIFLARFLKKTSTNITGGENAGKQLHNVNVVTTYDELGKLDGMSEYRFKVASNQDANTGCAVVVQARSLGPILGAAVCP